MPGKSAKSESKGTEQGTKRSANGVTSKTVQGWVSKWKKHSQVFDGHAILNNRSLADKGMAALWAITKVTGDEAAVISRGFLQQFLLEAFSFKENDRSLGHALERAKGQVLKVKGDSV